MSIDNPGPLPLVGKVIKEAVSGCDHNGYGFVELRFSDETILNVAEIGQTGEIKWTLPTKPTEPRVELDDPPTKSEMAAAKARELGLPVHEMKLDSTFKPTDF